MLTATVFLWGGGAQINTYVDSNWFFWRGGGERKYILILTATVFFWRGEGGAKKSSCCQHKNIL